MGSPLLAVVWKFGTRVPEPGTGKAVPCFEGRPGVAVTALDVEQGSFSWLALRGTWICPQANSFQ